jgi:NitT/TauT family transport system ATP-binding protein
LVHKPEVLILDEPFGALDAFTREDLWQVMHKLRKEEPFTGVLITHDLRESIFLTDEVIVLSGRPATNQYEIKTEQPENPKLESLFEPKSIEMLKNLRHQIEIAQDNQGNKS